MARLKQHGFSVLAALIIIVTVGLLGLVAFRILGSKQDDSRQLSEAAQKYPHIFWTDDAKGGWMPNREAPTCPDLILRMSPADTTQVTDFGYPGQWRGQYYKPHGLFSFARNSSNEITATLPFDASLVSIAKYKEVPENAPQYIMEFHHECGFAVRIVPSAYVSI